MKLMFCMKLVEVQSILDLVEGHLGQFPHFIARTSEGHYG